MPTAIDITDEQYGRLKVVRFAGMVGRYRTWQCLCECGATLVARQANLRSGATTSCGCRQREIAGIVNFKHGANNTPEYTAWQGMRDRCSNHNGEAYKNYGGRGIKVCDRWLGDSGFECFLADMGLRPSPKHSLDRYPNNDGNYEPGNCRWATRSQQNQNTRRARRLTVDSETLSVREWSERSGLRYETILNRLRAGWNASDAVLAPLPTTSRWRKPNVV